MLIEPSQLHGLLCEALAVIREKRSLCDPVFAPVRNDWVGESVTRKADENVTIKIEESLAREFLDAASLLHEEKVLPIGWQKPLELLYEDSLNEYPRVKSGDFSENTIAEIAILE